MQVYGFVAQKWTAPCKKSGYIKGLYDNQTGSYITPLKIYEKRRVY